MNPNQNNPSNPNPNPDPTPGGTPNVGSTPAPVFDHSSPFGAHDQPSGGQQAGEQSPWSLPQQPNTNSVAQPLPTSPSPWAPPSPQMTATEPQPNPTLGGSTWSPPAPDTHNNPPFTTQVVGTDLNQPVSGQVGVSDPAPSNFNPFPTPIPIESGPTNPPTGVPAEAPVGSPSEPPFSWSTPLPNPSAQSGGLPPGGPAAPPMTDKFPPPAPPASNSNFDLSSYGLGVPPSQNPPTALPADQGGLNSWPSAPTSSAIDELPLVNNIPGQGEPSAPTFSNTPAEANVSNISSIPENAPTDLSHLVDDFNPIPTPTVAPIVQPAPTSTTPDSTIAMPVVSSSDGGFPKWIIGMGVAILLIVVAASGYFILGIGKSDTTENTSLPLNQELTEPPKPLVPIENTADTATPTPLASPSAVISTSARDLLGR